MHVLTEPDVVLLPAHTTTAPLKDNEIATVTMVLKAVAGPIRLRLLQALADEREFSVGELTERVGAHYAAVSQHLARLRAAGLVAVRRSGHRVLYRTANPHLPALLAAARHLAAYPTPTRPGSPGEHAAAQQHT
ncbi:metalloregulator ArsR/SmtB family transcription factor [Streptomyces yunnanensis]|uniref:Metalloregulator ArsR/SmtB family transcription factor n=1 Tax=Streptomyces yunnanensis TaxID=156453 RepID=A0ABY8AHA7_9ACTN|nr:metalloregulator ArsR/SmtB family transcription factor [Streptomyces yunnanensis]WEB43611.1 metalloregulator ArsR/SmtB family transcription factor [Streptomyces yunnanensis]